jgi:hypothetical protein
MCEEEETKMHVHTHAGKHYVVQDGDVIKFHINQAAMRAPQANNHNSQDNAGN